MRLDPFSRLTRLTGPESRDDRQALEIIRASRTWRCFAAAVAGVQAAASSSRILAWSRAARRRWAAGDSSRRTGVIGVMLLTASAVHGLFNWLLGPPPGWLWLLVPGTASAIGVLLVLAGRDHPSRAGVP